MAYSQLCDAPSLLGWKLVESLRDAEILKSLSPASQCEIMILAFISFEMNFDMAGTEAVYDLLRERAQKFATSGACLALNRILLTIRNFHRLEFILDLFLQYDQFELVLKKDRIPKSNNVELALSLANFIKSRAPPNTDQLLIMIYLRFHMVRDLAQVSRTKAEKCIERIQEHLDRADVVVDLDAAAEALQVAMESYEQAECYRNMRECMHLRSLVLLQRKLKPTPVLRLNPAAALQFVSTHDNFEDCCIMAEASGLNSISDWATVVFSQAIQLNRPSFFQELRDRMLLDSSFYRALSEKAQRSSKGLTKEQAAILQQIMEQCEDLDVCLEIAIKHRWRDLQVRCAEKLDFQDLLQQLRRGEEITSLVPSSAAAASSSTTTSATSTTPS